jgi:hypothetical protein
MIGYGLNGVVNFGREERIFSLFHSVQTGFGVHPALYPMGTGACFPGAILSKLETDHSPPSSVEVKNGGAIPPHPTHFHGLIFS